MPNNVLPFRCYGFSRQAVSVILGISEAELNRRIKRFKVDHQERELERAGFLSLELLKLPASLLASGRESQRIPSSIHRRSRQQNQPKTLVSRIARRRNAVNAAKRARTLVLAVSPTYAQALTRS
jgi:hypothetical protein